MCQRRSQKPWGGTKTGLVPERAAARLVNGFIMHYEPYVRAPERPPAPPGGQKRPSLLPSIEEHQLESTR